MTRFTATPPTRRNKDPDGYAKFIADQRKKFEATEKSDLLVPVNGN